MNRDNGGDQSYEGPSPCKKGGKSVRRQLVCPMSHCQSPVLDMTRHFRQVHGHLPVSVRHKRISECYKLSQPDRNKVLCHVPGCGKYITRAWLSQHLKRIHGTSIRGYKWQHQPQRDLEESRDSQCHVEGGEAEDYTAQGTSTAGERNRPSTKQPTPNLHPEVEQYIENYYSSLVEEFEKPEHQAKESAVLVKKAFTGTESMHNNTMEQILDNWHALNLTGGFFHKRVNTKTGVRQPGTKKSNVGVLKSFLGYLTELRRMPQDKITYASNKCDRWRDIWKTSCRRRMQQVAEDSEANLIPAHVILGFPDSEPAREVVELLEKVQHGGPSASFLSMSNVSHIRAFLQCRILMENAQRAGIVVNLKLTELRSADPLEDGRVLIMVRDHKTSATYGAARVFVTEDTLHLLTVWVDRIRPRLLRDAADADDAGMVFVSNNGRPLTNSAMTRSFKLFWHRLGYGEVTPTLIRKSVVSHCSDHLQENGLYDLAGLMTHSRTTAQRHYQVRKGTQAAARGHLALRDGLAKAADSSPTKTDPAAPDTTRESSGEDPSSSSDEPDDVPQSSSDEDEGSHHSPLSSGEDPPSSSDEPYDMPQSSSNEDEGSHPSPLSVKGVNSPATPLEDPVAGSLRVAANSGGSRASLGGGQFTRFSESDHNYLSNVFSDNLRHDAHTESKATSADICLTLSRATRGAEMLKRYGRKTILDKYKSLYTNLLFRKRKDKALNYRY